MAHTARLSALTLALVLTAALVGCGGGGGTQPSIEVDATEALQQQGLLAEVTTDKAAYLSGEHVRAPMFITNVGTAERTVEFRSLPVIGEEPPEVDPGRPSWVYGDIRSTDDGYSVGFGVDFDPGLTMKIAPGEKIEAAARCCSSGEAARATIGASKDPITSKTRYQRSPQ
jgi:hypothetical protein